MLHSLILIPYYFFTALSLAAALMLLCRILRLKVAANAVVTAAVIIAVGAIVIPLLADWVDLAHFTGRTMLVIGVGSFVLATVDALLSRALPLPLDEELRNL